MKINLTLFPDAIHLLVVDIYVYLFVNTQIGLVRQFLNGYWGNI